MAYYIHIGPFGKCPDCGENTFVRRASLLSEVESPWVVPQDLMRLICRDIARAHKVPKLKIDDAERAAKTRTPLKIEEKRVVCSECNGIATALYWIEPVAGALVGPYCKDCLREASASYSDERGYNIDYPLYTTSANKRILAMARASLMLGKAVHETDLLPDDDDVVLF